MKKDKKKEEEFPMEPMYVESEDDNFFQKLRERTGARRKKILKKQEDSSYDNEITDEKEKYQDMADKDMSDEDREKRSEKHFNKLRRSRGIYRWVL